MDRKAEKKDWDKAPGLNMGRVASTHLIQLKLLHHKDHSNAVLVYCAYKP